jgi:uncharacterized protein involved in response to NO
MICRSNVSFWQLGFRPFFLLGSLFGMAAIFIWLLIWFGTLAPRGHLDPIIWHSHEMIYGFTTAVIAGFALTASQNWTGKRGVHGLKLKIALSVWALGRVLLMTLSHPNLISALMDLGFYPLLGCYMFPYLQDQEMKTERVFFLYFVLFFTGNLLVHLESFGLIHGFAYRGIIFGLNTIILMIIFMGGRVIPFFTESSLARRQPRTFKSVEYLSHITAWAFLISSFFIRESVLCAIIAFSAACVHLIRLWGWQVPRIRRVPLIWILHIAYLWITFGFFLSGLVSLGIVPSGSAVHAFAIGGIGVMTYGMMTRVSLGHTGRTLRPHVGIVIGYYLLNVSALIRVLGPLIYAAGYSYSILVSGSLWLVAFILFVIIYLPILIAPRIDGKPG